MISPELFSVECHDGIFKSTCYPVVTNRSDKNATVKVNAVAHGEDGVPVFAGTGEVYAIGPGESTVVPVLLTNSLPDGRLEFRVSAAETDNRRSAIADLVLETRKESKSVLTALTNYGSGTAESVHIFALFRDAEGKIQITASSSFFVPKPFTPFEWAKMETKEEYLAQVLFGTEE